MNLGKAIKEVRVKSKLSQASAAKLIGMSQQQLAAMEKQEDIRGATLKKIAKAYNLSPHIIVWMASDVKDVAPKKQAIFKQLNPLMREMMNEYFKERNKLK